MGNRNDKNIVTADTINNVIGESVNESSPQITPNGSRRKWKFRDSTESLLHFHQQSRTETRLLRFVVQRGNFKFLFSLEKKVNNAHFSLRRTSEMTP